MSNASPLRVVVMGVTGSGKTTIGSALAARLGARFVDADDLHPARNVEKMARGIPLTDADRDPWLNQVGRVLADATSPVVVACSALARRYRDTIRAHAPDTRFVHLLGDRRVLGDRLSHRRGHFMPATMLDSQVDALEPLTEDEHGVTIDATLARDTIVDQAMHYLTM
jgi:carbohydrate kinase (thermoresistant glucokinase family)